MDGRSANTSLAELFDKQVNAQKEKNLRDSCKLLQAHDKCRRMGTKGMIF